MASITTTWTVECENQAELARCIAHLNKIVEDATTQKSHEVNDLTVTFSLTFITPLK